MAVVVAKRGLREAIDCDDAGGVDTRISAAYNLGSKIATDRFVLQIRKAVFGTQRNLIR
jgi:hypothetical protein